jgi:tetratricopeptide (TPR) repeat protein
VSTGLHAQAKDEFVRGVADFINAAEETSGDRQASLQAAADAMAAGLATWDAGIAKVESGLAANIGGAPLATAARMRMALGAVYLERGRFAAAAAQFDAAAALDPSFPDPHVFRGLMLELNGRPADAAAAYRSAWQRDKASAVSAYRLLRASRGMAVPAETAAATAALQAAVDSALTPAPFALSTLDLLDDASSPTPLIPFASHADAFALLGRGRYDEAVTRFRMAISADRMAADADERTRLTAADARVAAGDLTGAQQLLREAITVYPASGRAAWKLGTLLHTTGETAGAAQALEGAAVRAIAGGGPLLTTIGRLHHARLDLDAAAAAYARRTARRPNDSAAHYDLADVFRARGDVDSALVEALAAVLLDPVNPRALAMIGQLHAAAGRDAAALPMLQGAVRAAPSDPEPRYALSRVLLRLGRNEEADAELAVFKRLQAEAMDEERRRFLDNQQKIADTLKESGR